MNRRAHEAHEELATKGTILRFEGVPAELDIYNPAVLDGASDKLLFAARVESRKGATDATIMFFQKKTSGEYEVIESLPKFALEDPSLVRIGGELVLSGVQADWSVLDEDRSDTEARQRGDEPDSVTLVGLRQIFYRGKNPQELQEFARGPEWMKDIRLVETSDGRVGVYTRPRGAEAGLGRIGYTTIDSLDELSVENVTSAKLLESQPEKGVWEGVNAVYSNISEKCECRGILGHRANRDEGGVHYVAMTFTHNPVSGRRSAVQQIASRSDFPSGEAKRDDLRDVVFPGGLIRYGDGIATLYAGLNDVDVGRLHIEDPFIAHDCP